jgi:hypothetical protein
MPTHVIEKTQSAYHFPLLIRSLFRSAMSLDMYSTAPCDVPIGNSESAFTAWPRRSAKSV